MTDPVRLLDSTSDDFERALLGSVDRDVGSPAAKARCLAAVSPALVLLTTSQTSSAALLLSVLKTAGMGVVLGAVVSGSAFVVLGGGAHSSPPPAPAPRAVASLSKLAPSPISPRVAPREPAPFVAPLNATATPPVNEAPPSTVPQPKAPAVNPPVDDSSEGPVDDSSAHTPPVDRSLEREVQALDGARQALVAGDMQRALAALDQYSRDFSAGALAPEAVYLRVRALIQSGQRERAAQIGRGFLTTHGHHASSRKLAQLLEQEQLR